MEKFFNIDNSLHLIKEAIFWYVWFVFFMVLIWCLYLNLDVNANKSIQELLLNALQGARFSVLLIVLFIIAPLATAYQIRKIVNMNNNIVINENYINYQERAIPLNDILEIKIGCCPLKGGILSYILVYGIAGIIAIPLRIFDVIYFFILKYIDKNNLKTLNNRFVIFIKNGNPLVGTIYDQKTVDQLNDLKKLISLGE